MWSQAFSGMWSGLFDVGGKVGETPQNSLTPAVPQGDPAHGCCYVSTELQATQKSPLCAPGIGTADAGQRNCSRRVFLGTLPVIAASGCSEQSLSPSIPTGQEPAPVDLGQQSAGEDMAGGGQTLS